MSQTMMFAAAVLIVAGSGLLIVISSRWAERIRVPLPALVLAVAVAVTSLTPVSRPDEGLVDEIVTVALVVVLFDGGLQIGRRRLRSSAVPIGLLGTIATLATAVAAGAVVHLALGTDWYTSVLVGAVVAPTDPTVVFSVLGRRQVAGRTGTILEGESGANDPVGIALVAGLLSARALTGSGLTTAAGDFALQLGVGAAVGVLGGRVLVAGSMRFALPGEGLYALRSLAASFVLYGAATLAHGSGFLAVFVAGIIVADEAIPFRLEVHRFHGALASLGEIAAFAVLGLTVKFSVLEQADVWVPGLVVGVVLAVVIRPVVVLACLAPVRLRWGERAFLALAGLKGAVPILLGGYLLSAHLPQAERLYGVVVVVVVISVVGQGGAVPALARLLRLELEVVEPQPYAVGVRLPDAPEGVVHVVVSAGSAADGSTVASLASELAGAQISLLVRAGSLTTVSGATTLLAGDEVTVVGSSDHIGSLFGG